MTEAALAHPCSQGTLFRSPREPDPVDGEPGCGSPCERRFVRPIRPARSCGHGAWLQRQLHRRFLILIRRYARLPARPVRGREPFARPARSTVTAAGLCLTPCESRQSTPDESRETTRIRRASSRGSALPFLHLRFYVSSDPQRIGAKS